MSRRRIGQEVFPLAGVQPKRPSSLDGLAGLIDWGPVEGHLNGISVAPKGEPAWPPLALKALLIAVWYDLSDVKLAEARRSPGRPRLVSALLRFSVHDRTPERTAFVRFRQHL